MARVDTVSLQHLLELPLLSFLNIDDVESPSSYCELIDSHHTNQSVNHGFPFKIKSLDTGEVPQIPYLDLLLIVATHNCGGLLDQDEAVDVVLVSDQLPFHCGIEEVGVDLEKGYLLGNVAVKEDLVGVGELKRVDGSVLKGRGSQGDLHYH